MASEPTNFPILLLGDAGNDYELGYAQATADVVAFILRIVDAENMYAGYNNRVGATALTRLRVEIEQGDHVGASEAKAQDK